MLKNRKWFSHQNYMLLAIIVIAFFLVGSYSINFVMRGGQYLPSLDSGDWGALGDFFGGILNPIVGVAGLILLIETLKQNSEALKISSDELAMTREELAETKRVQQGMAETERKNLEL
ncbi:hypothetical protein [Oceanobacter sp. 4_MG-2023]|uniref:hypothetical protein n=1 Tax=Oceanobacter sp. 4_MG-2023 TaxID=3062623 RepID=UPI002733AB7C|nr:hypothetical protein [Oceanobacter sp. 4_MG-2023]MDP2548067.1 hypothetical protein [Oceanobacter sp. 4_MG-2023]